MGIKHIIFFLIALAFITACSEQKNTDANWDMGFADEFVSDVIGVEEAHLNLAYWTGRKGMDKIIMNAEQIKTLNKNSTAQNATMFDLENMPDRLDRQVLIEMIISISKRPNYKRIYTDGTLLTDADFARYEELLNIVAIADSNPVRFGLVVKRVSARTFPTSDLVFSHDASDRDIERFQETALFPGEAIAVLHESADGDWYFVRNYNYTAWVPKTAIAIGRREEVFDYIKAEPFLLVSGDKVSTVFNPVEPRVSELQLDMGVRLKLDRAKKYAHNLYGQNPYLSHMVLLPVREQDGSLAFKHALIRRKDDVHIGYLPFTENNILRQSFKFLGERYGWGHRFNGRDCTGFIGEVYKSFGIVLPRNSGDQGRSEIGKNIRFDEDMSQEEKLSHLQQARSGDLIYIPGHVLMVLGADKSGEVFVIHDVHGLGYLKQDGEFYKGVLNGVSITPFLPLRTNKETRYLDKVSVIKSIR